jgi:YHS domain-containing protein
MLAGAAVLAAATTLLAQEHGQHEHAGKEDAKPAPVVCPVSGNPANLFVHAGGADGPVYFCCKDCVAKFEKAPGEYAEKVKEQRAALAKLPKVQVTCPMSGEPIDKSVFIEHDGQKVCFCCAECKGKFDAKNPEHVAKLAASYTYQTHCPMMGKDIDPAAYTDLPTGERVYWCCPKCGGAYAKKLDKFCEQLAAQGYKVDQAELKKKLGE